MLPKHKYTSFFQHFSWSSCGLLSWAVSRLCTLVSLRSVPCWFHDSLLMRAVVLMLATFWKRRFEINEVLSSVNAMNALSPGRYLRLMPLGCMEMACTIPISIYNVYTAVHGLPIAPWISWEDTHYNFSRVVFVPVIIWRSDPSYRRGVEMTRRLFPTCALLFFILFGFAREAQKQYRRLFLALQVSHCCQSRSVLLRRYRRLCELSGLLTDLSCSRSSYLVAGVRSYY
jgi:hypothetical protein